MIVVLFMTAWNSCDWQFPTSSIQHTYTGHSSLEIDQETEGPKQSFPENPLISLLVHCAQLGANILAVHMLLSDTVALHHGKLVKLNILKVIFCFKQYRMLQNAGARYLLSVAARHCHRANLQNDIEPSSSRPLQRPKNWHRPFHETSWTVMASKIQPVVKLDATTWHESAQRAARWSWKSEKTIFHHLVLKYLARTILSEPKVFKDQLSQILKP